MNKLICAFIVCLLATGSSAAEAEQPAAFNQEFESVNVPPQGGAIPVRVGVYILNLVALNEVEQTFTCTGYLTEAWNDSRLKFTPVPDGSRVRYYQKSAIWFPLLQFDNSAAPRQISSYLLSGDTDGRLTYTEKFSVTLSSNMHLRAFPFDSQNLEIVVHPFTSQTGSIVLGVDQVGFLALPIYRCRFGIPAELPIGSQRRELKPERSRPTSSSEFRSSGTPNTMSTGFFCRSR